MDDDTHQRAMAIIWNSNPSTGRPFNIEVVPPEGNRLGQVNRETRVFTCPLCKEQGVKFQVWSRSYERSRDWEEECVLHITENHPEAV